MEPSDPASARAKEAGLFVLLVVLGAAHWAWVFGLPPRLPRETADWPKEVRYYAVLKQAVTELRVPYYVSRPIQETRKFLAIPETVLSPQIVLLRWLDADGFLLANVILLHGAATLGCLWARRRYRLGGPSFVLLWLTTSFSGHIVAHLAIGHSMWGGYFLLPFFLLLVLEVDGGAGGRWAIATGVTLATMLLQGSFHVFVWCVLFLLVRLCAGPGRAALAAALGWAALLGLVRLAPAAAILQARRETELQTGFPGLVELVQGLALVRDASVPRVGRGSMGGLQWWEFDTYVGPAALVWLLLFGARGLVRDARGRRLAVPVVVMTLLSLDRLYAPVTALGVPLLSSQRVTSRFLILPLLALAVMAAVESSRWAAAGDRRRRVGLWCAAAATAVSLGIHTHAWRMSRVQALLPGPPHVRDAHIEITPMETGGPKDGLYVATVRASAAFSALALGVACWRWRRLSRGSCR